MIGYYPCVIFALLLIYSHSTNQTLLSFDVKEIKGELRKEKPRTFFHVPSIYSYSTLTRTRYFSVLRSVSKDLSKAFTTGASDDIACDKLYKAEKETVCLEAMKHVVTKNALAADHDYYNWVDVFLDTKPKRQASPLANASDPFQCNAITIEGIDMEKNMYWCIDKEYRKTRSTDIGQAKGFFISSSRNMVDVAYMFKPSKTDDKKVTIWAMMKGVSVFRNASSRRGGSSSSRGN